MKAKTNPLTEDVSIDLLAIPAAAEGCTFYATKTQNAYISVHEGTAFPMRFVVDADGARGICGCGGDMPCAHISALYNLATPPTDSAPQLVSAFFAGTDYSTPITEPVTPVPTEEPKTGIAAVTKGGDRVSFRAKVVQLWDSTSESIGQVGLLADNGGKIKFVAWANAGTTTLVEGTEYDFSKVLSDEYNGKMSVKLDKKASVAEVGNSVPESPELPPEQTTPEPAPAPPKTPGANTIACKYCGEMLDRSDMDAVLSHIERCKDNNNTPQVRAPVAKKDTVVPTEKPVTASAPLSPQIPPVQSPPVSEPSPPTSAPAPNGISNMAMAMCRVQQTGLTAIADSENPFHRSKYADLASVWDAIRKPLTDNGLCVIQTTEPYENGITVVTTLMHVSGETLVARLSCEVPGAKPDKNGQRKPNIQGLGSTITYLRRYSLGAMVGVCPVDDDGEAAHGR